MCEKKFLFPVKMLANFNKTPNKPTIYSLKLRNSNWYSENYKSPHINRHDSFPLIRPEAQKPKRKTTKIIFFNFQCRFQVDVLLISMIFVLFLPSAPLSWNMLLKFVFVVHMSFVVVVVVWLFCCSVVWVVVSRAT